MKEAARSDGRDAEALRPLRFHRGFVRTSPGSCLAECGGTRVLCTATIENSVPPWLIGRGQGWLTAEYSMLPGSTTRRKSREGRKGGGIDGRSAEIQRLIGRAFRPIVDLGALGERTVYLDCDVLEADGGTRVTSINGAYLALQDAIEKMLAEGQISKSPLTGEIGAVSVGIVAGRLLVDLAAIEDQRADADLNVVMTAAGDFIEVQGTGENRPFSRSELDVALNLATTAIRQIMDTRRNAERPKP